PPVPLARLGDAGRASGDGAAGGGPPDPRVALRRRVPALRQLPHLRPHEPAQPRPVPPAVRGAAGGPAPGRREGSAGPGNGALRRRVCRAGLTGPPPPARLVTREGLDSADCRP